MQSKMGPPMQMAYSVLALGAVMASSAGAAMAERYEQPEYSVMSVHEDQIEIRQYPSMLLAEVTVTGDRAEAANKAFSILFGYISGGNVARSEIAMTAPVTQSASQEIAMTAPVTQSESGDGVWSIAFIMPANFTRETLPVPKDDRVRIIERPQHRAAAIRFSGRYTMARLKQFENRLLQFVKTEGFRIAANPEFAFYDSPYTPFFMRRNEVIVELAEPA
jgi:DNA gyrase inhibitor GyrI